jgi:hypothetical protein
MGHSRVCHSAAKAENTLRINGREQYTLQPKQETHNRFLSDLLLASQRLPHIA